MPVQALGAKLTVESFDEPVIRRLSGSGEVQRDLVGIDPQIEVTRNKLIPNMLCFIIDIERQVLVLGGIVYQRS